MGLITKSEATHRLQMIASRVNNAVRATRDGQWSEASEEAMQARDLLTAMIAHLDEAAEGYPEIPREPVGSLKYGAPPPVSGRGGMGYRGSHHSEGSAIHVESAARMAPPAPIALPAQPAAKKPTPPRPAPIVTPPPKLRELPETRTFDLSRISGQQEWFERCKVDPNATDWEMTDAFDRLTKPEQEEVVRRGRAAKAPVTLG